MKMYPHFTTPLNDVRELKEALFFYKKTGNFYPSPVSVGQSELLLKVLYYFFSDMNGQQNNINGGAANFSDQSIYLFISMAESASIFLQLVIMNIVYSATPKKSPYTLVALMFILFNPIQLIGGFSNLASFNDFMFYLLILVPITGDPILSGPIVCGALGALCVYFDPRIVFLMLPLSYL